MCLSQLSQCWEIPFFIDCYHSYTCVYLLCINQVIVVAIKSYEASTNELGLHCSNGTK